jgi:hypothetical protein
MSDPKRLIVSEDNELGVALAVARRQQPSANRLAELAERLAQNGAPLPAAAIAPSLAPSPAPTGFRLGLKLKLGLGIIVLGALGGMSLWGRGDVATTPKLQREPAVALAAADKPASAPEFAAREGAQSPSVRRAPAAHPSDTKPQLAEREPEPLPIASVAPAVAAEPAPAAPATSVAARRPSHSPSKAGAPADVYERPSGEELPQTELDLLKQARNAVTSDPLRAYALTERSRALFPQASLAQERDFISITALYRMGREQQARSQALVFRSRYPRSAYLSQIARMLENE